MRILRIFLFGSALLFWRASTVPAATPLFRGQPPEASLLDIGIVTFDPGLPNDPRARNELEQRGIFPEVRRSEALYIPFHLARTLQRAGFWGAVRVVPRARVTDLRMTGAILESSGAELKIAIRAVDARGKVWLEKRYRAKAEASAYLGKERTEDPFQSLYDRIAKDLFSKRRKLDDEDVREIRDVSRLRFAVELAPVAFAGYLDRKKKDRFSLARLPARDDPMMARVERIRQRDGMFIDTLHAYYGNFYAEMQEPYIGWRSQDFWQREAAKNSRKSRSQDRGRARGFVGGGSQTPWGTGPVCGTSGVLGQWGYPQESASRREAERKSHLDILRELGDSLASDIAPHLVEVEGRVMRFTGTVETQYAAWRKLLAEIFETETGLPLISTERP